EARAGPSGWARPCSQSCSVRRLRPYRAAKAACERPLRRRIDLTSLGLSDTRWSSPRRFRGTGRASRSARARAVTSASVISARRFQFVRPFSATFRPFRSRLRGLLSGPTTTRVIRSALISARPPCRDQTPHFTAEGVHHEEHLAADHADNLSSLLGVLSSLVHTLDAKGISEDLQGIHEVDAVLDEVRFSLRLVPLVRRSHCT